MNVIVSRLVQHKLSLRYQSVGALEVVQDLHLMLIDGLHELVRPEPDIVVFVHEQEGLLGDLFLDLWHGLRIEFFEESHHSLQILLIPTVKQERLDLHASLQLRSKLCDLGQAFFTLVQIDHASIPLVAKELSRILRCDSLEYATNKLFFFLLLLFLLLLLFYLLWCRGSFLTRSLLCNYILLVLLFLLLGCFGLCSILIRESQSCGQSKATGCDSVEKLRRLAALLGARSSACAFVVVELPWLLDQAIEVHLGWRRLMLYSAEHTVLTRFSFLGEKETLHSKSN